MGNRRLAVIDRNRCNPKKCGLECVKYCPMVRMGKDAVRVEDGKLIVDEELCSGCGMCVRKCPFRAISVVNLPAPVEGEEIHRYGPNGFVLYRIPVLRFGSVVGLVGQNGVGKSTALKILSGELKPNLGRIYEEISWDDVVDRFRGSALGEYFKKLIEKEIKVIRKPERIDLLPKAVKGSVKDLLKRADERGVFDEVVEFLELGKILSRNLSQLSGGELQLVAVAAAYEKDRDVYIFDEPSNYLDVCQRMKISKLIRKLSGAEKAVLVVEHDLAVMDYISDYVHIIYGIPAVYGVVSLPHSSREGINILLDGYLPDDNVRFREEPLLFSGRTMQRKKKEVSKLVYYTKLTKSFDGSFTLTVEEGDVGEGEVVVAVGPNGIGKTTLVRMLAGELRPDEGDVFTAGLRISYKEQELRRDYDGSVRMFLKERIPEALKSEYFNTEVMRRLRIDSLMDKELRNLSSGELQRVMIAVCLGKEADFYVLDEPSAFLDVEMRMAAAKAIRRMMEGEKKAAFVVEHDLIMIEWLADRIVLFQGAPGAEGHASKPMNVRDGMNEFLKEVDVTFRRDPETGRPRVNKPGSKLDELARKTGRYYM